MAAQMKCPHCDQAWELTPEQETQYAGQTITCTNCRRPFTVGAPAPPAPPFPVNAPLPLPMSPAPHGSPVGYASQAYYGPQQTSALAIVSLVIACIGIVVPLVGLVGLILGIIALTKTRDPRVGGKGLAIAGIAVGGASLVLSTCMISILLPSLNRARETANRVKCASNLRQIGQAMLLYANDNRGAYPPTPDLLVLTQDIAPDVFICPSSNDSAAPWNENTPRATLAASILRQGQDSYVYVGKGLTNGSSVDTILVYELPANHSGDGSNFLYGDGHVEFQSSAAANAIIAEVNSGHNPPRTSALRGR